MKKMIKENKNGQIWYDDENNMIQAHGGMILKWNDI